MLALWAERAGRRRKGVPGRGGLRFAFYGRVPAGDWQDPVTSRARQREQAGALIAGHGVIVAEFSAPEHTTARRARATLYRLAQHARAGRAIQVSRGRWRATTTEDPR